MIKSINHAFLRPVRSIPIINHRIFRRDLDQSKQLLALFFSGKIEIASCSICGDVKFIFSCFVLKQNLTIIQINQEQIAFFQPAFHIAIVVGSRPMLRTNPGFTIFLYVSTHRLASHIGITIQYRTIFIQDMYIVVMGFLIITRFFPLKITRASLNGRFFIISIAIPAITGRIYYFIFYCARCWKMYVVKGEDNTSPNTT